MLYIYICRDNSNVCKAEWQSLLELSPHYQQNNIKVSSEPKSEQVSQFHKDISRAARRLMDSLGKLRGVQLIVPSH